VARSSAHPTRLLIASRSVEESPGFGRGFFFGRASGPGGTRRRTSRSAAAQEACSVWLIRAGGAFALSPRQPQQRLDGLKAMAHPTGNGDERQRSSVFNGLRRSCVAGV